MKKVKIWLHDLPEPHRTAAFQNMDYVCANEYVESLKAALVLAFSWAQAKEGHMYWINVYNKLK